MNFKKIISIITSISIASTLIIGCSSKITKESIEEGKTALAKSNYEEASRIFDFALQKNPKNEEIKNLQRLSNTYLEAEKAYKEINYNECKKLINELETIDNCNLISNDLNKLKTNLSEAQLKDEEFIKYINEVESLINERKFNDAKKILNKIKNNNIAQQHIEKINLLFSKINEGIKENNNKIQQENTEKITINEALTLLKNKVKLNQDQYYKISSEECYILQDNSKAYVINKYYKPINSSNEQLIAQYYIDAHTSQITEEIVGIKKEIN